MWDSTDYALNWPAELLIAELARLRATTHPQWTPWEVRELLNQAFHTTTPGMHFDRESYPDRWLSALLDNAQLLRPHETPQPYWRARKAGVPPTVVTGSSRAEVAGVWTGLYVHGYFGRDTYNDCGFGDPDIVRQPSLQDLLKLTLGDQAGLWLSEPEALDDDTFYELIEVLHDLAGRPRQIFHHYEEECDGHPHDYDTDSGRRIYRALVNRVLDRSNLGLRLAEIGEDTGRLVRTVDDARTELIAQALAAPSTDGGDRVQHAIALFRRRGAEPEDKRSAVVALFGVLEERSPLVKATPHITSKDESDLFNIANNFAFRHQDVKQKRDYDPIFLDWIFWWFLSAIEVTNQVLQRQNANSL